MDWKGVFIPGALIFAATVATLAQGKDAMSGQVTNDLGEAIPGVIVNVENATGTIITVFTQLNGKFNVGDLKADHYTVSAERTGYTRARKTVDIPGAKDLEFELQPGPADRLNLSSVDQAEALPDSPYKKRLIRCERCHNFGALALRALEGKSGVTSAHGYRLEDWLAGIKMMQRWNFDGELGDSEAAGMAEYLQEAFGPDSKWLPIISRSPIDAGGLNIKYQSYDIPTPNAMPHTVVSDGKGNIWFTEFGGSKIGRVNVPSGKVEEFGIPTERFPGPYGIAVDPGGDVWFAEQTGGTVARFNPTTKEFKEYWVPKPLSAPASMAPASRLDVVGGGTGGVGLVPQNIRNASPHTLISDKDGNIWFTAAGDPIRKLDPKTGEFSEYIVEPKSGNIGDVLSDNHGRIWYSSDGNNVDEVGFINTATGKVTRFPMLTPNSGPGQIKIDSNGMVWVNLNRVNRLARIDPTTAKVVEWRWPGATEHEVEPHPLGIDAKNRIWIQSALDDSLYMFDPQTEIVTTYQMPEKGENPHDLWLDENGWLWTASFSHSQVIGFKLEDSIQHVTVLR